MVSRLELYELVWSAPMTKVAAQFNVSSNYLARVCVALNVPSPPRGYWAKAAVGAAPARQILPDARPGDQLSWKPGGELRSAAKRQPVQPTGQPAKFGAHWLINNATQHFENSRPVEESDYLKPYKKLLVDITSSKACINKAFAFASSLFMALEAQGHRVALGQSMHRVDIDEHEVQRKQHQSRYSSLWKPREPTIVYIGDVAVGLAIIEMSEDVLMRYVDGKYIPDADYKPPKPTRFRADHTWTTTKTRPCGRLRLIAYCPSWRVSWSTDWQETRAVSLDRSLKTIVSAIERSSATLSEKLAEANRLEEAQRLEQLAAAERSNRAEDRRRIEQSIKDSHDHLAQIIQQWASIRSVEQFLLGVETSAASLPDNEKVAVLERLALARKFLGSSDPMQVFRSWKLPSERYQPKYSNS